MQRQLFVLALVLALGVPLRAQAPKVAWDYLTTQVGLISSFEVRLDGGPWISIGVPTPESLPSTPAGYTTFAWVLPSALGNGQEHIVSVRACHPEECSTDPSLVFRLTGPPENLRIIR